MKKKWYDYTATNKENRASQKAEEKRNPSLHKEYEQPITHKQAVAQVLAALKK